METKKLSKSNQTIVSLYERGYRCDDYGNIIKPDGTYQKTSRSALGYVTFNSPLRDQKTNLLAHRFIMFCRAGERLFTKGLMVLHKNDNGLDNSSGNLYLGTRKDNARDALTNNKHVKRNTYKHLYSEIYNYYLLFGQKKTIEKYRISHKTLRYIKSKLRNGKHTTSRQISIPF